MSTLELLVFQQCSGKLLKVIQPEVDSLSWDLYSEGLIGSEVKSNACESGKTKSERASHLLNGIEAAIGNSSANFEKFLNILRAQAVFQENVDDLEKKLRKARQEKPSVELRPEPSLQLLPHPPTLTSNSIFPGSLVMHLPPAPSVPYGSETVVGAVTNVSHTTHSQHESGSMLPKFAMLNLKDDYLHESTATRGFPQPYESAFNRASLREVSPNPFSVNVTAENPNPPLKVTAATPQKEVAPRSRPTSLHRWESTDSGSSSCDEEARELIEACGANIDKLDVMKKRLQQRRQKSGLKKRIYQSQLEGKERELQRLEQQVEQEKEHNSTNVKTITSLLEILRSEQERARAIEKERGQLQQMVQNPSMVHELERWKKGWENAQREVEMRNREIARLQQQIEYLLQQGAFTPVDPKLPQP